VLMMVLVPLMLVRVRHCTSVAPRDR